MRHNEEKHWGVVNSCSCESLYGYHKCTCNHACHTGDTCSPTESHHCASYSTETCTCDQMCYGESTPGDWDCAAPDLETEDQRDVPTYIMGRIYLDDTTYYDTDPSALASDWADIPLVFDENPATSAEWIPSEVSGISAIGYVATGGLAGAIPEQNAETLTPTFALSSNISHMYALVGWDTPRPVAGIHLYKNSNLINSSYRPVRRTGYRAHWSDNVAPSGTFTCNRTHASYPATNFNDGNHTTRWTSSVVDCCPISAICDFGASNPQIITRYDIIKCNSIFKRYDPYTWTFQGSNDGVTYTTLDTQTAQLFGGIPYQRMKYSFTNTTAYQYYRLRITAQKNVAYNMRIAEIELFTWVEAVGSVTNQTTQSVSMHYLSAGDKIRVVPTVTLVDDYIVSDCPSGNYISVAKLTGQGGLL